jgi:hypothetical protein
MGDRVVSATDPHCRNLSFRDPELLLFRSSSSSVILTRLSDPVPNSLLLRKSGSAGNRTWDLWICSQELWPLERRGRPTLPLLFRLSSCVCIHSPTCATCNTHFYRSRFNIFFIGSMYSTEVTTDFSGTVCMFRRLTWLLNAVYQFLTDIRDKWKVRLDLPRTEGGCQLRSCYLPPNRERNRYFKRERWIYISTPP